MPLAYRAPDFNDKQGHEKMDTALIDDLETLQRDVADIQTILDFLPALGAGAGFWQRCADEVIARRTRVLRLLSLS